MVFDIQREEELHDLAMHVISRCKDSKIFTLSGPLGAGKTTFVKFLCTRLGCNPDEISSPTFSIVNEYFAANQPIFHMDLYRIKNIEEALDFGIEDYLFSGNYCFIEWAEIALPVIDMGYYAITITITPTGSRCFEIKFHQLHA